MAEFIIFGEAGGIEGAFPKTILMAAVGATLRDFSEHLAADARRDTGRGDGGAQRFADDQVFGVGFGEFIEIMPAYPRRGGICERAHRHLDHGESGDERIMDAELLRMDDIFGIVKDDGFEGAARARFFAQKGGPEMIEAIGLAGGAGAGAAHGLKAGVREAGDGALAFGIIGIKADEDAVIGIIQRGGEMGEHGGGMVGFLNARVALQLAAVAGVGSCANAVCVNRKRIALKKPSHLLLHQPEKTTHNQGSSGGLNQITPRKSMVSAH